MIISVVSGKGGSGKTVISANIAASLSKTGKKTVIADADFSFGNLDIVLGAENQIVYNIFDVLSDNCDVKEAAFNSDNFENLYFLSSGNKEFSAENNNKLCDALKSLAQDFDYVIVDCLAINNNYTKSILSISDIVILVVTPDVVSLRDAERSIKIIEECGGCEIKLIINKVLIEDYPSYYANPDDIIDKLGINLLGIIPETNDFDKSVNEGILISENETTIIKDVFENITSRLLGEYVPITKFEKQKKLKRFNIFR